VPPTDTTPSVILDPSVLFTDEALEWLADEELRPYLVISESLWQLIEDPTVGQVFVPWGVEPNPDRVTQVRRACEPIRKFSHGEIPDLPPDADRIRNTLVQSDEILRDCLADEWVFVTSQSLAVLAQRARRTIAAFIRAGVEVYEITREEMNRALEALQDSLPPHFLQIVKAVGTRPRGRIAKFVLGGGQIALGFVPHLAIPVAVVGAIQMGAAVIGGDP
jgi:hypothetical protein